ncbi:MAG: ankyrin repeat domain-containing protein [Legionella sp.]|nr:ankyrin repeat domain-containing protein [Legionella sp.]
MQLPIEIIIRILSYLNPEMIFRAVPNKVFLLASRDRSLWQKKLRQHFPYAAASEFDSPVFTAFREIYLQEYSAIPQSVRPLFSYIKEYDMEGIKKYTITPDLLRIYDRMHLNSFAWAALHCKFQAALDFFYSGVIRYLDENLLENNKLTLLWSIICLQPFAVVEEQLQRNTTYDELMVYYLDYYYLFAYKDKLQSLSAKDYPCLAQFLDDCKTNFQLQPMAVRAILSSSSALGNIELFQYWLKEQQLEVDELLHDGKTALWIAAQYGQKKMVTWLLQQGANIHIETPLQHTKAIYIQIAGKKFYFGHKILGKETPLHRAIWGGHLAVVKILLEKGADYHAIDAKKRTPLMIALKQGYTRIAEEIGKYLLLDYLNKLAVRDDAHYNKTLRLFGCKKNFGYSAHEKKKAALALKNVVWDNAPPEILIDYLAQLEQGSLATIARLFSSHLAQAKRLLMLQRQDDKFYGMGAPFRNS